MKIEDRVLLLLISLHITYTLHKDIFQLESLLNVGLIFVSLTLLRAFLNVQYKKDTLGFGDIKLISVISFLIPLHTIPYVIFFASLSALIIMFIYNVKKIPFAPSIITAWFGVYIWLLI